MHPLPLLRPCVAALDELAHNYRTSVSLCPATQHTLVKTNGEATSFKGRLPRRAREIPRNSGCCTRSGAGAAT